MRARYLAVASSLLLASIAGPLALRAAPLFYLSDLPLGAAEPGLFSLNNPVNGTSGQLNLYAMTDERLAGVSLDLFETGGGLKFNGLNVLNDGRWWILDGPQVVETSRITSIGGGALPGISGNGIGPGDYVDANYHPSSGYHLATIDYEIVDATRPIHFEMKVGQNAVADWQGGNPMVHFGNLSQPAVPGTPPPAPRPINPPPPPFNPPTPLPPVYQPPVAEPPTMPPPDSAPPSPRSPPLIPSPLFYFSDQPLGVAKPGVYSANYPALGATGQLNIYAKTEARLSGVSLDLLETGGGIEFSGLNVVNDGRWWILDGPLQIERSQITSIGGGAMPGFGGNGIGSGADANYDPESGYLLATVEYHVVDPSRPLNFELRVGRNAIADWQGNIPNVHFGDLTQPAVPGAQPITLPPVPTELPDLPPTLIEPPSGTDPQPNEPVDPTFVTVKPWPSDWGVIDLQPRIGVVGEERWAERYYLDEDGASEPGDFILLGSPILYFIDGDVIKAAYSDGSYSMGGMQARLTTIYSAAGADTLGAQLGAGLTPTTAAETGLRDLQSIIAARNRMLSSISVFAAGDTRQLAAAAPEPATSLLGMLAAASCAMLGRLRRKCRLAPGIC